MKQSCPYCNHSFEIACAECPRCGEPLRFPGSMPADSPRENRAKRVIHPSNVFLKAHTIVVLILMLGGAGVGLLLLSRDPKPNAPAQPPSVGTPISEVAPPLELRGLSHLPANCNIVLAVQPGPLLVYAEKHKLDPVELLTKNRVPASMLAALAKAGITLQQIDHIVAGLYLPEKGEEFRIAFVLVLRQKPADEPAFLDALKAKPVPGGYEVLLDRFPLRMKRASETDWVLGLTGRDLEGGPTAPGLKAILGERIPRDAASWLAIERAEWTKKPLVAALLRGTEWPPDRIAILAKGQAVAASYSFGNSPRLLVSIFCADSESRTMLKKYFDRQGTASEVAEWATLEKPVDPQDTFGFLKSMMDDAGR